VEVVKVGVINEQRSSGEKMEIISRIKEISFDLERTAPETGEYQKELLAIVGRINTWTEGANSDSGEQVQALRKEILWLLNDIKTGKGRNGEAIPEPVCREPQDRRQQGTPQDVTPEARTPLQCVI
jgi:hypothetical protein